MMPPGHEASCAVRGLLGPGAQVRLVTRTLSLTAQGQTSVAPGATHPSSLDLLVSALVADLLGGLHREAARSGVVIHDAELSVSAHLDNPLVALGVIGESGTAAVHAMHGSLYLTCDEPLESVEPLWRHCLERAPVYATLRRCAEITIQLKPAS